MTADERVASILADWSESQQRGEWTDPADVIAANPDVGAALRAGFAALDYVDLAVGRALRALMGLTPVEQRLTAAEALAGRLEGDDGPTLPPGARLETSRLPAREAPLHDEELARRALAVAAAVALDRVWQTDRLRRRVHGFEWLSVADRRILDECAERFRSENEDVLDRDGDLLRGPERLDVIAADSVRGALIRVCALGPPVLQAAGHPARSRRPRCSRRRRGGDPRRLRVVLRRGDVAGRGRCRLTVPAT